MKKYLSIILPAALAVGALRAQPSLSPMQVCPGVWRMTIGTPEEITPVTTRHYPALTNALAALAAVTDCPLSITGSVSRRGCLVNLPLTPGEMVYGLGLQFKSFC